MATGAATWSGVVTKVCQFNPVCFASSLRTPVLSILINCFPMGKRWRPEVFGSMLPLPSKRTSSSRRSRIPTSHLNAASMSTTRTNASISIAGIRSAMISAAYTPTRLSLPLRSILTSSQISAVSNFMLIQIPKPVLKWWPALSAVAFQEHRQSNKKNSPSWR